MVSVKRPATTGPKKNHQQSTAPSKIFAARRTAASVSGVAFPNASVSNTPTRKPFNRLLTLDASAIDTGADSASPASGPATTSNIARTSAIVRAIGPTTPSHDNAPAPGG